MTWNRPSEVVNRNFVKKKVAWNKGTGPLQCSKVSKQVSSKEDRSVTSLQIVFQGNVNRVVFVKPSGTWWWVCFKVMLLFLFCPQHSADRGLQCQPCLVPEGSNPARVPCVVRGDRSRLHSNSGHFKASVLGNTNCILHWWARAQGAFALCVLVVLIYSQLSLLTPPAVSRMLFLICLCTHVVPFTSDLHSSPISPALLPISALPGAGQ